MCVEKGCAKAALFYELKGYSKIGVSEEVTMYDPGKVRFTLLSI